MSYSNLLLLFFALLCVENFCKNQRHLSKRFHGQNLLDSRVRGAKQVTNKLIVNNIKPSS